ncbi:hypothetical protein GGC63_001177 [Paenibacillus sp. OAS669]|nr:hypothetical protein [Paenibacillus sp. OAS669]
MKDMEFPVRKRFSISSFLLRFLIELSFMLSIRYNKHNYDFLRNAEGKGIIRFDSAWGVNL